MGLALVLSSLSAARAAPTAGAGPDDFAPPVPVVVVPPVRLPWDTESATVKLSLTVDEQGRPLR